MEKAGEEKLKACPWCGADMDESSTEAEIEGLHRRWCPIADITFCCGNDAWNTRAVDAENKRLRAALNEISAWVEGYVQGGAETDKTRKSLGVVYNAIIGVLQALKEGGE